MLFRKYKRDKLLTNLHAVCGSQMTLHIWLKSVPYMENKVNLMFTVGGKFLYCRSVFYSLICHDGSGGLKNQYHFTLFLFLCEIIFAWTKIKAPLAVWRRRYSPSHIVKVIFIGLISCDLWYSLCLSCEVLLSQFFQRKLHTLLGAWQQTYHENLSC